MITWYPVYRFLIFDLRVSAARDCHILIRQPRIFIDSQVRYSKDVSVTALFSSDIYPSRTAVTDLYILSIG